MKNLNIKNQNGFTLTELVFAIIVIFGAIGWVLNIYKLASTSGELAAMGVLELMRAIGILVFPLGAVLGYIN
jgi:prepilin-type N-terminal cleavage/methylation domain-containing protein